MTKLVFSLQFNFVVQLVIIIMIMMRHVQYQTERYFSDLSRHFIEKLATYGMGGVTDDDNDNDDDDDDDDGDDDDDNVNNDPDNDDLGNEI